VLDERSPETALVDILTAWTKQLPHWTPVLPVSKEDLSLKALATYVDVFRGLLDIGNRHCAVLFDDHHPSSVTIGPSRTSIPTMVLAEE
jgi:hypothetical protein